MDRSHERARTPVIARWQYGILTALCVAGGLTLTMMVIGSSSAPGPDESAIVAVAAIVETTAPSAVAAEPDAMDAVDVVDVPDTDPVTDADLPVAADAVAPATAQPAAVAPDAATTGAAAPVPADAGRPAPPPLAAPSPPPAATSAPAPTEAATSAPSAPTPAPAPAPTAAPTTTPAAAPTSAPAPTTSPTPTSAPAAALSFPSYVSNSATVVLQSDGSSIAVASVTPQADWVFEIEKNGPRSVEIKFFNVVTKRDGEFHASLEGGRIKVEN